MTVPKIVRGFLGAMLGWLFPPTGQRRSAEPLTEPPAPPSRRRLVTTDRAVPLETFDYDELPLVPAFIRAWEQEERGGTA